MRQKEAGIESTSWDLMWGANIPGGVFIAMSNVCPLIYPFVLKLDPLWPALWHHMLSHHL